MVSVIKIGILGILGVLLAVQFKSQKPEFSILTGIAICVLIFGFAATRLEVLLDKFEMLKQYLNHSEEYLAVLFKVLGITYVCEFSAGICKDAGYAAVAEQIEIMGKLSVIFAGLPILLAVIEQIQGLA